MQNPSFRIIAVLFLLAAAWTLSAQADDAQEEPAIVQKWLQKKEDFKFRTTMMVQLWSMYSTDYELYDAEKGGYEPVDDRLNIQLRRARVVFRGSLTSGSVSRLLYSMTWRVVTCWPPASAERILPSPTSGFGTPLFNTS